MALDNTIVSITKIVRGLIHDKLRTDGRDPWVYDNDNSFTLSEPNIDSTTIKVFQNDTEVADTEWSYDSDTNEVTINFVTSGLSLTKNDIIIITYSYYQKYSNTEIKGYIESSLSYFAEYKFKKIFEVNSSDKVVAINDLDPTKEELYFIAIIASIVIDPQNTKIDIPDLKLSPNRDVSDQEQIREAFSNFTKFIGSVSFMKLENELDT